MFSVWLSILPDEIQRFFVVVVHELHLKVFRASDGNWIDFQNKSGIFRSVIFI